MSQSSVREILVRCAVSNRTNDVSVRFVEKSHFRLWQYMMANKHHILVDTAAICLWLPNTEFNEHATLFNHAGPVEPVNRISLAMFDKEVGLVNVTQRFVPDNDTELVSRLLLSRVPGDLQNTEDVVHEVQPGYAIVRTTHTDLAEIELRLQEI